MNCVQCEIKRAKMLASLLYWAYWDYERIAAHLSKTFGESYFVKDGAIYRKSKLPPHDPHLIREKA